VRFACALPWQFPELRLDKEDFMPQIYPIEGPPEAKKEILALYEELRDDFPDAELKVREDTGDYCIIIDYGEPFMRITKH
jgi:hypothetical protein